MMRVMMFRSWYVVPYSGTFSTLDEKGIGGTELQLLLHARALRDMGCEVTVVGVTHEDKMEEEILFKGSNGKQELLEALKESYGDTDVLFANVTEGLDDLRRALPRANVVQVCQNGPHFNSFKGIDIYAFVGFGQFAYYSSKFRKYRQKFMMLPSVPPWYTVYSRVISVPKENQIIWLGSVNKQGLRRWAKAMRKIMDKHKALKWVLCVPSYDLLLGHKSPAAFSGISLPLDRIEIKNLPLSDLAIEIKRSKILLASLGGEDGPVSYLDGHALELPVLSGDDIYGKYYNPDGTGLRCTTTSECERAIDFLLANPGVCETMGEMGKKWVIENLTEEHQKGYIEQLVAYLSLRSNYNFPIKSSLQSDRKFPLRFWLERLEIKGQRWFNNRLK